MADAPTLDHHAPRGAIAVWRVVALMNAGAGSFNQRLAGEIESQLASAFAHRGVAVTIKFVEGEDLRAEAEKAVKQAKHGEIDAVVVGGGDGSVRTAAGVLAGTGVPLGVLPLGTLNHFAKDLGIPLQVEAAAWTIAAGHVRVSRSCRGQRRDVHQQFLDRHLSLHGHRPRAAARRTQARQMDGYGAGVLPHAAALPAPAIAHQGAGLCHPLPHALPVRRQQRIRHRAVHLRQAKAPRSRRALVLRGEAAQSRSSSR